MKTKFTFAFLALFSFGIFATSAQKDTIFTARKQSIENLDVFKSTINDTTKDVLKEWVDLQNKVIAADKPIIEVYLDTLKSEADSLTRAAHNLTNDKADLDKEIKSKSNLIFYGMIGAGVLFLLFVVFLILFLVTSGKKNKLDKQIAGIEKIKQESQEETAQAKKDATAFKANAQKEVDAAKEKNNIEVKNLQAKIDSLSIEKANLDKRVIDKINECTQLQIQITTIKESYELKLKEVSLSSADFINEKMKFEKELFDKNQQIENLIKEKDNTKQDFADYKDLYEKESRERKLTEERLIEKENELKNLPVIDSGDFEAIKNENGRLKEDIDRLNERLDKEAKTKEMIEDELRRFIDELRGTN